MVDQPAPPAVHDRHHLEETSPTVHTNRDPLTIVSESWSESTETFTNFFYLILFQSFGLECPGKMRCRICRRQRRGSVRRAILVVLIKITDKGADRSIYTICAVRFGDEIAHVVANRMFLIIDQTAFQSVMLKLFSIFSNLLTFIVPVHRAFSYLLSRAQLFLMLRLRSLCKFISGCAGALCLASAARAILSRSSALVCSR